MRRVAVPRVPLTMALVTLYFWPFPATKGPAQAARDRPPSALECSVDPGIAPDDDFFAYANGAWLKATALPAGRDRWTVRDDITARTRTQVAAILEEARTAPSGSLARKVADFRPALMNAPASEAQGIAPLTPALARIDS